MARKHFELTHCTQAVGERVLHRIRATEDIPQQGIVAGMLGGWVEKRTNLTGRAWVDDDARVFGDAKVFGEALLCGDAQAFEQAQLYGAAVVTDEVQLSGHAKVLGQSYLSGHVRVTADQRAAGQTVFGDPPAPPPGESATTPHVQLYGRARDYNGVRLRRVRALRDLPHAGVVKGDIGGWVEKLENLIDVAWVADDAKIYGDAVVAGCAVVADEAEVYGHARVGSPDEQAYVYDFAQVYGHARVLDCARVYGNAHVSGRAEVTDLARVFGNARLRGRSKVADYARVWGDAVLGGAARVGGRAEVWTAAKLTHAQQVYVFPELLPPWNEPMTVVHTGMIPDGYVIQCGVWQGNYSQLQHHIEELPALLPGTAVQRRQWLEAYTQAGQAVRKWLDSFGQ